MQQLKTTENISGGEASSAEVRQEAQVLVKKQRVIYSLV